MPGFDGGVGGMFGFTGTPEAFGLGVNGIGLGPPVTCPNGGTTFGDP